MRITVQLEKVTEERYGPTSVLLQTPYWGALKRSFGQTPVYFRFATPSANTGILLLSRKIAGPFSLAYVPHGPAAETGLPDTPPDNMEELLTELCEQLRHHLPNTSVFLRLDLPWAVTGAGNAPPALSSPFRRAAMDIQPVSTVLLSLSGTEEDILGNMKPKTRYNIRLAQKKGVIVAEAGLSLLPLWYSLYEETAERDKIAIHSLDYYKQVFSVAGNNPGYGVRIRLFLAWIEDKAEAGIITATAGDTAVYLYGASSNNKREYMPSYALQWEAILQAREDGASWYDFFGIPPLPNPDHPMAGLYRFKTGFGGIIVNRPGCWDYPLRPFLYRMYRSAENLRTWYYRKFKKRGLTP